MLNFKIHKIGRTQKEYDSFKTWKMGKSFIIIQSLQLSKTLSNMSNFISCNNYIFIHLVLKHLTCTNNCFSLWMRNESPYFVLFKFTNFILHNSNPFNIIQSIIYLLRFNKREKVYKNAEIWGSFTMSTNTRSRISNSLWERMITNIMDGKLIRRNRFIINDKLSLRVRRNFIINNGFRIGIGRNRLFLISDWQNIWNLSNMVIIIMWFRG